MRGAVIEPPSRKLWMRRHERGAAVGHLPERRSVVISVAQESVTEYERVRAIADDNL